MPHGQAIADAAEAVLVEIVSNDGGRAARVIPLVLGLARRVGGVGRDRDGAEGLATFRARRAEIDLIISDMVMPGLTGAQVYEAVRRDSAQVPFPLSSGYKERPDQTVEVPAGVRVVPKPWTIDELARTVREELGEAPERNNGPESG